MTGALSHINRTSAMAFFLVGLNVAQNVSSIAEQGIPRSESLFCFLFFLDGESSYQSIKRTRSNKFARETATACKCLFFLVLFCLCFFFRYPNVEHSSHTALSRNL